MYLHLLPGGGSSYYAQKQQTALYFVFYLMEALFWDVFIWFFPLFFSSKRFLERFFPMDMLATCPMLAHPSYLECVFLCNLVLLFYFALLSISISARFALSARCHFCTLPFLHVAQSLLLKCNGLSVRCMQSVNVSV